MTYLRNQWYAAGWESEVTQTPFMRQLLDEPVVFYRTESGRIVALSDKCPHRYASLHLGKVFGEDIRCPYHGLRFAPDGACVHSAIGTGAIPPGARVRHFEILPRNGIIWLWHGDGEPDPALIPDFSYLDATDQYDFVDGYIELDANYALVSDNLLDLSHAEFIHPNLSSPGSNRRVQLTVEQEGNIVHARNWRPSEPTTGLMRLAMENPDDTIDMWSDVTWAPPAALTVEVGGTAKGADRSAGVTTRAAHLITPQTAERSHYFWKLGRTFNRGDQMFGERLQQMIAAAFSNEDKPMIESQQRNLGNLTLADLHPLYLPSDGGAARARRVMERLARV